MISGHWQLAPVLFAIREMPAGKLARARGSLLRWFIGLGSRSLAPRESPRERVVRNSASSP